MSRRPRLALIAGGSLAGLLILAAVAVTYMAQSQWLRDRVRQRIVAEAEKTSGGHVEIQEFQFDWSTLTAQLSGLVIHGTEPAGSPPLLRVRFIAVQLKVISFLRRVADVAAITAVRPEAHLLINPDGTTNVPQPKVRSNKNPVAAILDLAVGQFQLRDGTFQVNSQRLPWNASGKNVRAQLFYNRAVASYSGDLSVQSVHFIVSKDLPVDLAAKVSLALERNKLTITRAHLETPKSFADLSGSIDSFSSPEYRLQYAGRVSLEELVTTLRFRAHPRGILQVAGAASFNDFGHYAIAGRLSGDALAFGEGKVRVHGLQAASEFHVDPQKIDLTSIRVIALGGTFHGGARVEQLDRIRVNGEAENFDLQRVAQAFALGTLPWDGVVSGPVTLGGLISELNQGRLTAHAQLVVSPAPQRAPVRGVIDAVYDGYRGSLDLGRSFLQLPSTRLDFAGTLGRQLRIHFESSDLHDLQPAIDLLSNTSHPALPIHLHNGSAEFTGSITGPLPSPQIAGHAEFRNITYKQKMLDSLSADLSASASSLHVQNGALSRGNLQVRFAVNTNLRDWSVDAASPITANASLRGGDMHELLAIANHADIPASGPVSGSIQFHGTLADPQIAADASLGHGSFYGESFNVLSARLAYDGKTAVVNAQLTAAKTHLTLSANYTHAPQDIERGHLTFQAASNGLSLDQFHLARIRQLTGNVQFTTTGTAEITRSQNIRSMFSLTDLQVKADGRDIQLAHRPVGEVHLTASTAGSMLAVQLQSSVANSTIHIGGQWRLAAGYPGSAEISFSKLDLASLESWLGLPLSTVPASASIEGKANIAGPAFHPEAWTGALEIPRLEIVPLPGTIPVATSQELSFRNQDSIRLSLRNEILRVESAHLIGPSTDIALTGLVSFRQKSPLDLHLAGKFDLAALRNFTSDLTASGQVAVNASIEGSLAQPRANGRLELNNANLNVATFSNGLSNANGVILFTGDRATFQNITAQSGGGKVTVSGFATERTGGADLHIEISAEQVRLRYPEGVSTLANARLTWTGTSQRSLVSGSATILRTGFTPRTDLASMLAASAQPAPVPASHTGLLGGINFDVQIDTSPDVSFQSEIAQQIQADAHLRLRGSATNPVLLGRVNITQGQLVFFGNKYSIGQASVSFLNPIKIEPIINMDLQTKARGVDVTITISGPINKMNVTYRSDPPLQFADIVALLATGRAPTGDPSLAASQTGAAQTWQQLGASALVGQAIASPVSSRLQRFFGVSNIKIDPTLTGITNPQARLTIEQQVTPAITFTYITYLTQSNPQVIQVEWSLNRQVSVLAVRDENGLFGLDFLYKKRFK